MDLRLAAAVNAGKAAGVATRLLRRGGGTALPGLVALRLDPAAVRKLGRQLGRGRVLVTGTNGKTTTSRILASILAEAGFSIIHNREGSNLLRGMASTLLASAGPGGRLRLRGGAGSALGLFETDEASLPGAARDLAPSAIAFTNLFRDQLDRYGEVDTVAALWREALALTPRDATLVLNADDPSVAELATGWLGPIHWFGLDDAAFATTEPGAVDARWCRACGGTFVYDRRYFAHLGYWRCSGCGRSRPTPGTAAESVSLGPVSASFVVPGLGQLEMPLTGVYNVSNALAAIALARVLGIGTGPIARGVAAARPAFGRQETVELEGRRLRIYLCKNPAGANQVIRLLQSLAAAAPGAAPTLHAALLLNDRFADGQDVSWTWDVDYELLAGTVRAYWAGGTRAEDMALRLKYAGWPPPLAVEPGPAPLLEAIIAATAPGDEVAVIPTYTAMLDLRTELGRRGVATRFGDDA